MKKLTTLGLLALAAAGFTTPTFAQVAVSPNSDDLVLAFRVDDTTGTGANTNLEVDLGQFSLFNNPNALLTLTGLTSTGATDLATTYGANFATRGDISFSVSGASSVSNGSNTGYFTQSGSPQVSTSLFKGASGNAAAEEQFLGSSGTPTSDSSEAGTIGTAAAPASGIAGSYTSEINQTGGAYGFFTVNQTTGLSDTEAVLNGPLTTLNLYSYVVGSGRTGTAPTELGTFEIYNTGVVTYTGSAEPIPEPSTYALMFSGLGLLVLAIRRRWISVLG